MAKASRIHLYIWRSNPDTDDQDLILDAALQCQLKSCPGQLLYNALYKAFVHAITLAVITGIYRYDRPCHIAATLLTQNRK